MEKSTIGRSFSEEGSMGFQSLSLPSLYLPFLLITPRVVFKGWLLIGS